MTTSRANLAALRFTSAARSRAKRDTRVLRSIDSEGCKRHVDLPAPAILARTFVAPWIAERRLEAFSAPSGASLLTRPSGSAENPTPHHLPTLAEEARLALAALPVDPTAYAPYNDVRTYMAEGSPGGIADYLTGVLRSVRQDAPTWRAPRIDRPRGPAMTPADRMHRFRARTEHLTTATSAWWLALYLEGLDDEDWRPARTRATALWSQADEGLAGWADEDPDEIGFRLRRPGRTRFYETADQILGARRFVNGHQTYIIPTDSSAALTLANNLHARELLAAQQVDSSQRAGRP